MFAMKQDADNASEANQLAATACDQTMKIGVNKIADIVVGISRIAAGG